MKRKIAIKLVEWKNSRFRKPLILQGARQVGKTYTLLEFGKNNYDNVAYINFEMNESYRKLFDGDISPERLIPLLSRMTGETVTKERTLMIFDEVQLCERALTSLKYFAELAPEYHIVAAGSLLGIAVNRTQFSFPVGKVDFLTMYPMNIEEFLLAFNEEELIDKIRFCFNNDTSMDDAYHPILLEYYHKYLVVGGMPEAVSKFIATQDYLLVRLVQNQILNGYLDDMSKYNKNNEIKKTRLTYNSITVQLSKMNTRFQYKLVKSGGRAAEFENAIEWLELTGIISICYKVEQVKKPLKNYIDADAFKVYMSDIGLLCAKKELKAEDVLFMVPALNDFKGGMVENYVSTQLQALGYSRYFWESSGVAEIDFIIQRGDCIIPVEVKSATNTQAKSLQIYMKTYKPPYAIKISEKNFGMVDGKKSIPLYAVFCL